MLAGFYLVPRAEGAGPALRKAAAAGAGGDRARLAAVHRRGAVRDPRHRPQPGHVAAPVRGRPAGRRGQRALDRRRLSARAARDRRRAGDARAEHGRGLRGADDRDRGRRLPRGAAAAARAQRLAPIGGRGLRRLRLPDRRLPGPGRVQGDDPGAVRDRVRDRARRGRPGVEPPRGPAGAAGAAAGGARRGQRLRLQLPRAALARRRRGGLGGDRARPRGAPRRRRRGTAAGASGGADRAGRGRGAGDRGGPGARADRRFRLVRDLRSGRRRARQPVRPSLAAGGARYLALRRLPGRAGRRRRARVRLLPRRRWPGWPRSSTACAGRCGGAGGRCRRRSQRRLRSGSTRCSPGPRTRRRRRW